MVTKKQYPQMPCIRITKETKEYLDNLRIHKRETYGDIMMRIIEEYKKIIALKSN